MKQYRSLKACLLGLLLALTIQSAALAVDFRFPVGVSYVNGAWSLNDKLKQSYEQRGYTINDNWVVPFGLVFSPYMELENGLGFDFNLGPSTFFVVKQPHSDDDNWRWSDDDSKVNFIIPVGGDIRYTFLRDQDIAPYVRAGIRYPVVGGDDMDSSTVGGYGGVGVEFWRTKKVSLAVEIGYDSSEVKLKTGQEITPNGLLVSVSAVF